MLDGKEIDPLSRCRAVSYHQSYSGTLQHGLDARAQGLFHSHTPWEPPHPIANLVLCGLQLLPVPKQQVSGLQNEVRISFCNSGNKTMWSAVSI